MILEIPVEAIEHDYFLTDVALKESQAERMAEIRTIGLPDHWAGTASNMISGIHSHLTDKYGGLDAYLDGVGFSEQERTKVKTNLLY
jgi:protein-tyrosine phosphatase